MYIACASLSGAGPRKGSEAHVDQRLRLRRHTNSVEKNRRGGLRQGHTDWRQFNVAQSARNPAQNDRSGEWRPEAVFERYGVNRGMISESKNKVVVQHSEKGYRQSLRA